jgi:two-component system, OmpR family, phosphate regulon response regulator PhoB
VALLAAKQGLRCLTAENAIAVFELLKTEQPVLILVDVHLRDATDGFTLTRRLRRNLVTCKIPVVIYSGVLVPTDAANALEAGADAYITLPTQASEFGAVIRKYIHAV